MIRGRFRWFHDWVAPDPHPEPALPPQSPVDEAERIVREAEARPALRRPSLTPVFDATVRATGFHPLREVAR